MAHCKDCNQDMTYADGCTPDRVIIYPDGIALPAIPFVDKYGDGCWDCGIAHGFYHHPGCEGERCPRHGGQLISCGCGGQSKEAPVTSEQLRSEEWLRHKLDEIRDRLAELALLSKAAYQRGDIAGALTLAREGEKQAAMGYECVGRLHDLTEPVEECPAAVGAVEDMLGLETS